MKRFKQRPYIYNHSTKQQNCDEHHGQRNIIKQMRFDTAITFDTSVRPDLFHTEQSTVNIDYIVKNGRQKAPFIGVDELIAFIMFTDIISCYTLQFRR